MKGFKGFDKNLVCRDFQYEIGKTYEADEPIELCSSGFHFCENLASCFRFYNPLEQDGLRFCEVESCGDTIESSAEDKIVTEKITIIRELSPIEVYRTLYGSGDGSGYGYGYGYGDGYGDGSGSGYGYGYGYGYGDGFGDGDGSGYGYGDGSGYGYGDGYGSKNKGIFDFMEETT